MGIFKRGTGIAGGHVGTRAVLKAYQGSQLVRDDTRSAFVSAPMMRVNLAAPAPSLSVGSTLAVDGPAPIYYPGELHPIVSAGSTVLPTPAGLSINGFAPSVSASAKITVPPMVITVAVLPAGAGLVDDGTITPSRFRFDIAMPDPVVSADTQVTVEAPAPIYVEGIAPVVTAGSTATPPPAAISVAIRPPTVVADALIVPPKATIAIGMRTPTISAGATNTPPPIVVMLATPAPDVRAIHAITPAGMDKSGDQTISAGVWTKVTGWTVRSGYSGTVITSDGIQISGGGPSALVFSGTNGYAYNGRQIRIVRTPSGGSSSVIITGPVNSSGTDKSLSASGTVTLANADNITVEYFVDSSFNANTTLKAGSYLTINPA